MEALFLVPSRLHYLNSSSKELPYSTQMKGRHFTVSSQRLHQQFRDCGMTRTITTSRLG